MTINEMLTYINCPKSYELMKECQIENGTYASVDEKYSTELHRSIYYFFNQLRSEPDDLINFSPIKKDWGKRWVGARRKKDILIPEEDPVRILYRRREREGTDCLFNVYKSFADMTDTIISVDLPGKLVLSPQHNISGSIPLITADDNDDITITDFRMFNYESSIKRDLTLSYYSILFRRLFNTKESKIKIFLLDKNKFVETTRGEKDYSVLVNTYKNVVKGINSDVYFRSMSRKCDKCAYSYYC